MFEGDIYVLICTCSNTMWPRQGGGNGGMPHGWAGGKDRVYIQFPVGQSLAIRSIPFHIRTHTVGI